MSYLFNVIYKSTVIIGMHFLKCVLIRFDLFNEILFSLSHHRGHKVKALVCSNRQKSFYELLFINISSYERLQCQTFEEYLENGNENVDAPETLVIMDVPTDYNQLNEIIMHSNPNKQEILLVLPAVLRKYLKFIEKKFNKQAEQNNIQNNITIIETQYPSSKNININSKIKELVEMNYDINRAAFYSYGAYIKNYQANLVKRIFDVSAIFVNQLAKSYGFSFAPRVLGEGFVKKAGKNLKDKKNSSKKQLKSKKAQKIGNKPKAELIKKTKIIKKQETKSTNGPKKYLKNKPE